MKKVSDEIIKTEMGKGMTFMEAVTSLADANDSSQSEVLEILADEAYGSDERAEYEFETQAENAWLKVAEYDAESQQDLYGRRV